VGGSKSVVLGRFCGAECSKNSAANWLKISDLEIWWQFDVAVFARVGVEAEPLIEWQRAGMIQRACVHFQLLDRVHPRVHHGVIEKIISKISPDKFGQ
jgi:hypothetical protein